MKETFNRAGKWLARLYIGFVSLVVFMFPLVFGAGFIFLTAWTADALLPHSLLVLAFVAVFCLFGLVFFSAFAWPHISPVVDKLLDVLVRSLEPLK
jgi:hypothetical protein